MNGIIRRIALGAAVAAVGGMMASLVPAQAAEKTVWNLNMWGSKRAFTAGIEKIKEVLEAEAPGQFELKIHYGAALGPAKQNPDGVKIEAFESAQMCVGYAPNKFPLLSVMELPFLLPVDLRQRAKVEMAVMQHPAIIAELKDRWNIKFFGPAFLPAYEFMGNRRIETTADMKGVKMRISGLNAQALQAFGAVPTMVTAPEGYNALSRGTIDSFGFPYSYAFGAYKLYEVSKYVTEGVGMGGFMCFQGVNIDSWNSTPEAVRNKMPEAQKAAIDAMVVAYQEADKKWIPLFNEKLEVVQFSAAERKKLAAGASDIWAKWVKDQEAKGRPGKSMLDFVKAEVAKATM